MLAKEPSLSLTKLLLLGASCVALLSVAAPCLAQTAPDQPSHRGDNSTKHGRCHGQPRSPFATLKAHF